MALIVLLETTVKILFSIVDDYSIFFFFFWINSKDQVFNCLVEYINEAENITNKKV